MIKIIIRHRNDAGGEAPERLYLLLLTRPTRVRLTTCPLAGVRPAPFSDFAAQLSLFTSNPAFVPATRLIASNATDECAEIVFDFRSRGSFFAMIEGISANEKVHKYSILALELFCFSNNYI